MKSILKFFSNPLTMMLAVLAMYFWFAGSTRPQFDPSEFERAIAVYPVIPLADIKAGIPSIDAEVRKGPAAFRPAMRQLNKLSDACARKEHSLDKLSREEYAMLRPVCSRVESTRGMMSKEFFDLYGAKAIGDAVNAEPLTQADVAVINASPEAVKAKQLFWLVLHFWGWYLLFGPVVLYLRFQQLEKSMWYEVSNHPYQMLSVWLFPPMLLKYPDDMLYQDIRQGVIDLSRWLLWAATSVLSAMLSFGSMMVTAGLAKAQTSDTKKQDGIAYTIDYRRTDRVAGNASGGLPNTLFVQFENVPKLPKQLVLESISAFGEKGYQSDAYAAVKTFSRYGLRILPTAGVQFNTNGSRGFVYGTQMSYKRGRLAVSVPNIWRESVVSPKRTDTFWVIARPLYNVRGALSLCGEVNYKKSGQSPGVTTLGFGLDVKARFLRIKAIALWKSDGAWLMRKQAVASGVF